LVKKTSGSLSKTYRDCREKAKNAQKIPQRDNVSLSHGAGKKMTKKVLYLALTNTDFLPRTNADFLLRITGGGRPISR